MALTGMLMCLAHVSCSAADSFVDIASQVSSPVQQQCFLLASTVQKDHLSCGAAGCVGICTMAHEKG